ncbi:hypothetical protein U8335_04360 [Roseiconus lacunae]|uniref:hypothetical protein n=1 Tax=Roseiconus lacunae TaxID=2605694 RepID=UPI00308BF2B9|nr:hypothetical protein U8335_04360 [Stieleria sp. HD01]
MSGKNVVVRLKGDERDLVSAMNKAEASQKKLTRSIGAFGAEAKAAALVTSRSIDDTGTQVLNLDKVIGQAGKNLKGLPKGIRDHFAELAKSGGQARSTFERIDDAVAMLGKTSGMTAGQMERMRQTLKKTANDAEMSKAAKENKRAADSIVRSIGRISPELRAITEEAEAELSGIGIAAEAPIEHMLQRMRQLGPEGKEQAAAIEKAFNRSLDDVEQKLNGPLSGLRELGPAHKKAAEKIKRELVVAGQVSESSMKRILDPLGNLGPRAAKAAKAVEKELTGAATKSTKSWVDFAGKASATFGAAALVAQSTRFAIDELNRSLERQAVLRAEAKDANRTLATVQAEALPSLAGMNPDVQKELIDVAPRKIAGRTGIGLTGAKELAESAGIVVSSGVSRPDVIKEVMSASADLNQLTPESISEFAKAIAGALKASGQEDSVDAVRTTASAVIAGMKGSGVTTLEQFAVAAPRALAAGALASDGGKFSEAAGAFDALAIAGAASQKTGDDSGDRSSTFAAQMAGKLDQYFDSMAADPSLIPTGVSRSAITGARTPLARLQAIHRFGLQDSFRKQAGSFGDATFQGVIEDLLTGGQVFRDTLSTRRDIEGQRTGPRRGSYASDLIQQQSGLSPTISMNIDRASKQGESAADVLRLGSTGKASAQASLDIVKQTIAATEDSVGESFDLVAEGYRPGPVAAFFGFDGSIERDGFGGNDLQQVARAEAFLQKKQSSYFTQISKASPAATMGVTSRRASERPLADLSAAENREVAVFDRAIEANKRLFTGLGNYSTKEIAAAAMDVFGRARSQLNQARSDERISPTEAKRIGQSAGTLGLLKGELDNRDDANKQLMSRVAELLERIASATEATADVAERRPAGSSAGAQAAAYAARE